MVITAHPDTATSLFESADGVQGDGSVATSSLLSRSQLIERIITHNPTASVEFLEGFSQTRLRNYLDHLISAQIPRGRMARWVRPGDTPGIVMAEPRD